MARLEATGPLKIDVPLTNLTQCFVPARPLIYLIHDEAHRVQLQVRVNWVEVELLCVTL